MVHTLHFFPSSKCSLFHNSNVFCSCIIQYTGCAKIKNNNNSGAKRVSRFKFQADILGLVAL
jgi:hypothetical protein